MKNKRGSHVGVVVSFIIFITFILFLRVLLEPSLVSNQNKEIVIKQIDTYLTNATSVNVKTITIDINSGTTQNCVSIDSFISDFGIDSRIAIKNKNDEFISSSVSSANSNTLQINRGSTAENFFKIYFSENFDNLNSESLSCENIIENSDFEYGFTKDKLYLSEEKILSLIGSYDDYEQFRNNLNIPNGTDAGIGFDYGNGTEISTNGIEPTTNIYLKEKPITYINKNADIKSGKIKIKIW